MPYGVFSFQCLNWGYSSLFLEMLCFQLRAFAHPLPSPSAVGTNFVSYDVTVNCSWTCALGKANCCSQPIHTCVLMPSDIVHRSPSQAMLFQSEELSSFHPVSLVLGCVQGKVTRQDESSTVALLCPCCHRNYGFSSLSHSPCSYCLLFWR